jgi:lipoyl(octanoyl) transferase
MRAGLVPYDGAVELQEQVRRERRAGRVPDTLLLLEHPPVITLGRGADTGNLLMERDALEARGIQVRETARGGDVTYHGPGQLVGYPIFDLNDRGRDVHRYLRDVEEALIAALRRFGIEGRRVPKLTGVWVGDEKVAAIGIGVRQWVTWHGFALNVSADLDAFKLIVPCGIRDRGVTSLERLVGRPVTVAEASAAVIAGFAEVFGLAPEERSTADLASECLSVNT